MRIRILNCEPKGYSREALKVLQQFADVDEIACDRRELIARIGAYDGLIVRLGHAVNREVMEVAPRLKFIATATTGLNHIDLVEAERRNIAVISLKGEREFLDTIYATAEHAWALLLALLRRLPASTQSVLSGQWNRNVFKGQELHGKTLGILGYGRLGSTLARYGLAFGMKVLAHDPYVNEFEEGVTAVSLETLAKESEVVSLHVPCCEETIGMIGRSVFALMKRGSLLINTARGEVLDESALLAALREGHLGGAALDVLCGENSDDPAWIRNDTLIQYAREHQNLIITPHIGGATQESMSATEEFMAQKIMSHLGAG